ncbi:helix-turn-helix transcriptional regulator (plasmid) [Nitrobacteraceae bacterium UC4446_H13]
MIANRSVIIKTGAGNDERKAQRLEAIIDGLYDAASDPGRWPAVLAAAADLFNCSITEIVHIDFLNNRLSFLIAHGYDVTPERVQRYEAVMHEDRRLAYAAERPFLPMHCRMIMSDEELHASRVYKEVLAPDNAEYSLGVNLTEEAQSTTFFQAQRGIEAPCFNQADCDLLGELVPHLRRAMKLYRRFAELDLDRLATLEALDQVPLAILVVERNGTLVTCNRAAQDLLARDNTLSVADGFVAAADPALSARLREAVDLAADMPDRPAQALLLPPQDGGEPLRLVISSLPGERRGITLAQPARTLATICIADPKCVYDAPWELLQYMFGLMASEARLLAQLVTGATVAEAAERLGVTEGSARQYLKAVFTKTGTSRQSSLIRKVLTSPLWISRSRAGSQA